MRISHVFLAAFLGSSCGGGQSASSQDASEEDAASYHERAEASVLDSGSDPDALPDGEWISGGVLCCPKGKGVSCCPYTTPASCLRYGGILGRCMNAGEQLDAHDLCSLCCPGLSRVSLTSLYHEGVCPEDPWYPGCCLTPVPSALICLACGDGVCDQAHGEDPCTCPVDCGTPSAALPVQF